MQIIMSFTTQDACELIRSVLRKKGVKTDSMVSFDGILFNVSLDVLKEIVKDGEKNGKK